MDPFGESRSLPAIIRTNFNFVFKKYQKSVTNRFLLYMALGGLWVWAKYSHGVWERFAHQESTILKNKSLNFVDAVRVMPALLVTYTEYFLLGMTSYSTVLSLTIKAFAVKILVSRDYRKRV